MHLQNCYSRWRADKNGIKEKEGEKKYIGAGGGKQV